MAQLKTPVTVRLNPDLLAEVRQSAARDNRSLTNFIETALRERVNGVSHSRRPSGSARVFKDNKNQ
ncbi:MAG TPA: YlcI/YnfO family protein [Steroidobacteraceae bacterium]|nr:YlcI/YnfO family protein [Steroidobacteraceae bacterium]